jgi:hypothetical protein
LPVLAGFVVYESFMSDQVPETGIMAIPQPGEQRQGGHESPCLGYDLQKNLRSSKTVEGQSRGRRSTLDAISSSPDTDLWMVHIGQPWHLVMSSHWPQLYAPASAEQNRI